uniref:Uncharacterized protein n=1 Tax=Anguilla anguilla TaxID=7936 RepID=A0A0E9U4P8_ANGAN
MVSCRRPRSLTPAPLSGSPFWFTGHCVPPQWPGHPGGCGGG